MTLFVKINLAFNMGIFAVVSAILFLCGQNRNIVEKHRIRYECIFRWWSFFPLVNAVMMAAVFE